MLKLQQVFANAPDRESRIRDDRDDRQPRFFQRQILVDIHDEHRAGAWRLDDDRLPFGFELLERATFREINFGEPADQGAKSVIAGREAARPGFELCARCGKVQQPNKDPEHALSCPSRKPGAKPRIESCLYLYRAFASEALRILLPMTDLGTSRQLSSFVAALQAGLKERFGGRVDHLRTTVYSDPVAGSTLRKTIPGDLRHRARRHRLSQGAGHASSWRHDAAVRGAGARVASYRRLRLLERSRSRRVLSLPLRLPQRPRHGRHLRPGGLGPAAADSGQARQAQEDREPG